MKLKSLFLTAAAVIALGSIHSQGFAQSEGEEFGEFRFERAKEFRKQRFEKRQAKKLAEVDVNEDGKIDLNEYLGHAEQRFNLMDADSDGFVTPEEQTQAHEKMREEFKQRRKARREQQQDGE